MLPDQEPEAVHEVVFVELQVNVDDPPEDIEVGLAERLTVGGGVSLGSTVTMFPADVHSSNSGLPSALVLPIFTSKLPLVACGALAPKN